jgi:hypothetical protein
MHALPSIDLTVLSTVTGGQAASAPATPPAPTPGDTELANTIAVGANANMCSLMDRNSIALGQTAAGAAMAAQADQCWTTLRTQMAGGAAQ